MLIFNPTGFNDSPPSLAPGDVEVIGLCISLYRSRLQHCIESRGTLDTLR